MHIQYTLRRSLVALAVLGAALTGLASAKANNYYLYGNPGYTFPGSPQGDPFTPGPPQTSDMAYALQSSLGKPVTIVSSQPYENTSLAPKIADQNTPPNYGYGPGSNGTVQNPTLNQIVLSGIVSANIHWVGTDRILGRVDLNRYVVRLFTATRYYDALLKVTSYTGSTIQGDYYAATWSFQEVSAARNVNSLLNISSRAQVFTGQNVMFAGFTIQGSTSKTVMIRGLGPSLANFGLTGVMSDPTLELRNSSGGLVYSNNNWADTQGSQIQATGFQPSDYRESAILITLNPGSYTATLQGYGGGTGIAICEVYDMNQSADSQPVNLSSRAYVNTDPNALFAGFIIGGTGGSGLHVVIRAIGPSLGNYGIVGPLQDPTLEVRDVYGNLIISNNNWQDNSQQASAVQAVGLAPSDYRESAASLYLSGGNYTAIVRGLNGGTGVGVVDMYKVP